MNEEQILIHNLKVNLKILGEGEPLLILHGWGSSSDSWKEVQRILAGQGLKVIVPDLPGFGKSVTPGKPWGVQDYKDFVLSLTEKLKIPHFYLLGHSFGGRIAIRLAKEHPEKIKNLILCDSAGIKPQPGFKTKMFFLTARLGNILFSPKPLRRLKAAFQNMFYLFLRNRDYVKANGNMRETIKKVLAEDLKPELSEVKTKTLLIWGERDKMVPLEYAYLFNESLPNSQLEILPKTGHSPHLEAPEKLSKIISNFLKNKT